MISQEIQQFVRQQIQQAASANRFQLSGIPRHIHNNVDSPFVFQPTATYVGKVLSSGDSSVPFPVSFSSIQVATGEYFVKTGFDETFYVPLICPSGNAISPSIFVSWIVETVTGGTYGSGFYVTFFDTSTQTNTDTDFYFMVTNISNQSPIPPQYTS